MKVIVRSEGHYNAQKVQFGTVYRWCPGSVVVECDCGERPILTHSETTCLECGGEHADIVREELAARRARDETIHPWHYAENRQEVGLPC